MALRSLSSFEKKILIQTLEKQRNGIAFTSTYSTTNEEWYDDATLSTVMDSRLTLPILSHALKNLIAKNIELAITINENIEFEVLKKIKTDNIITSIKFGSFKDERINCHAGAPPYLLHHIFNNESFVPGSEKPLWNLYVVDESLIIFHGHDSLFDVFSGANFHKLLLDEVNNISQQNDKKSNSVILEYVFQQSEQNSNVDLAIPKSIYDNAKIHLPAKSTDLFNLQTQSFFKSIYFNTVKKPFDLLPFFNTNPDTINYQHLQEFRTLNGVNPLDSDSTLCGTTVFGTISKSRFKYLNSLVQQEHICFRSLIVGITMLCLKPLVKDFNGNITFSMPIDLRDLMKKEGLVTRNFGLYYKEIMVDVPLSLIDDNSFTNRNDIIATKSNESCNDTKTLSEENSEYMEQLLEHQLKQITNFVKTEISDNIKRFEKFGFDDDDIRRMKYSNKNVNNDKTNQNKVISICDTSDIVLGKEFNKDGLFNLRNSNFTKSLVSNEYMSVCYSYCQDTGLNLCIHFLDSYNMENFVECFQSFIEE